MAAASTTFDENVNFLYRAMVERDPKKRRVKPVERHMLQLDFGDLEDSSDDSDFKVADHEDDGSDSNESINESEEDDDNEDSDEKEGEGKEVESTEDSRSDVSSKAKTSSKKGAVTLAQLIEQARVKQAQARQRIAIASSNDAKSDLIKVLICAVCLGDISENDDEIVECDGCGVSVHEGCYGISDSETVDSTASACSTEPWFCEACKAGNTDPICELCPNSGGIFKETDVGKWVHLVCALYVPGVAFGDVDKLSPVTLFEMPYSKWGAKACVLCEDERFNFTGVTVCCDAGLCRHYFHATCAQREGLLSEASPEEVREIADPFFAYCKLHADKTISRNKRRNYLALQSRVKQRRDMTTRSEEEKSRIARKLQHHQTKYLEGKTNSPQAWVPTQKMPRMLTSSPSACRKLIRKTELMGINTETMQIHGMALEKVTDIRKKWHIPPAFSVEFVSYYLDRNVRMTSMQSRLDEQLSQNSQLQDEEQGIRKKYDALFAESEKLKLVNTELREQALNLYKILDVVGGKKLNIPEILRVKKVIKSASKHGKKSDHDHGVSAVNKCNLCKLTSDQHLLAKCDTCRFFYHLGCLDPPLTRMPKKTKLQGWQCSECDRTDEEENEDNVDPNAPRKLREHIKEPIKFTPPLGGGTNGSPSSPQNGIRSNRVRNNRKRSLVTKKVSKPLAQLPSTPPVNVVTDTGKVTTTTETKLPKRKIIPPKREIVIYSKKEVVKEETKELPKSPSKKVRRSSSLASASQKSPKTSPETKLSCCRCNGTGDHRTLVQCDECSKCFHFQCLDPPVKKSPKQRGYRWHCEDCDPSDDDGGDDDDDDDGEEEEKEVNIPGVKSLKIVLDPMIIKEEKPKNKPKKRKRSAQFRPRRPRKKAVVKTKTTTEKGQSIKS